MMGIFSFIDRCFSGAQKRAFEDNEYQEFSDDDFRKVALDIVYREGLETNDSFFGGTVQRCDDVIAKIENLRAKYAETEPRRLKRHVLGWLDYYEREARKDRDDCVSQKHRLRMNEVSARMDEERASASRLRAALAERKAK